MAENETAELGALRAEIKAVRDQAEANHASVLRAIEASQKHMERRFESAIEVKVQLEWLPRE